MVKVLSQSGNSLADIYDVEGSIAGIESLETDELPIVHELGGTVFSERLSGEIARLSTGAILQDVAFDVILTSPPVGIYRVLDVLVITTASARVEFVQMSLRDPLTGREMPFFIWESGDATTSIRIVENGGAAGTQTALLMFGNRAVPTMGIAEGQPRRVGEEIVMRGLASSFGAGTVTTIGLTYLASGEVSQGALSSRGLPVPAW